MMSCISGGKQSFHISFIVSLILFGNQQIFSFPLLYQPFLVSPATQSNQITSDLEPEFSLSTDARPCKLQTLRTLYQSYAMTLKISKIGNSTSTVVYKSTMSRMRICSANLLGRASSLCRACRVGAAF